MKRRVVSLQELLDTVMLDCTTQRRVNKEEVAHLLFCHKYSTIICLFECSGEH